MTSPIPAAALEFHTAILGKTGSGKSFAAQGEVERLIAKGERVCIIDPTDRYWGLRLSPDGKRPGYEVVIFGGAHADLPLAATHGAALAEIVGTTATPVIIATRLMTVGERTRFFTDFAEALLRKNEGPLHLVIDEAHLFAPQSGAKTGGAAPAMLHAANNLVSLGRGIGLRIILISQRPAKLHKDSLTQVETLVALRLIAPQDRNAIRDWVKEWADEATGAEMMQSLPSLPTGTAWVWSPELGILHKGKFPAIATFDSGKPLASGKGPALASIDLAAVRGKLEIVAKDAIENDPARLKRRVAELEAELRKAPKQQGPDPAALDHAHHAGYSKGKIEGYAEALKLADPFIAPLRKLAAEASELAAGIEQWAQRKPAPPAASSTEPRRAPAPAAPKPAAGNGHAPAKPRAEGINGPQQRILDALAWWESVGVTVPTRVQIAVVAGYSPDGGAFSNPLGALRTAGLVEYPQAGVVSLTAEGRQHAAAPADAPTTEALHEKVMAILDGPKRRILEPLLRAYPDAMTREDLAAASRYDANGGAFSNPLGALRSLGLVDYPARGHVTALPILFVG
jgi:hypothetical protein